MKILVSGFGVFGTHTENSSEYVVNQLKEHVLPSHELRTVILPVTFSSAFEELKKEIESFKPDYVICLGLAGNRKVISLEKIAINLIHCDIPDNEGVLRQDLHISKDGPVAYFSTLPLEKMRLVTTEMPVEMSFSAGTYVCNYLMYRVLDFLNNSSTQAGFIHLPPLDNNHNLVFRAIVEIIKNIESE